MKDYTGNLESSTSTNKCWLSPSSSSSSPTTLSVKQWASLSGTSINKCLLIIYLARGTERGATGPLFWDTEMVLIPDFLVGTSTRNPCNCTHYYFLHLCGVFILSLNGYLATKGKAGMSLTLGCVDHVMPAMVGSTVWGIC